MVPSDQSVMSMGISWMKRDYALKKYASRTAKASFLILYNPGSQEEVLVQINFLVSFNII